ncbi:MAG: hypothetical protein ACQEQF_05280 [Bacillota bacterium]
MLKKSWNYFKKDFWRYILFNIFWFLIVSFLFFAGLRSFFNGNYLILFFLFIIAGPVLLIGLLFVDNKGKDFKGILKKVKKRAYSSILTFVFSAAIYALLVYDLVFVINIIGDNKLLFIFPVVILYIILIFNAFQIPFWGLLIRKNKISFFSHLKKSLKSFKNNFIFTFFWSLVIFVLTVALVFSRIGALFFLNSSLSILILVASDFILKEGDNK